MEMFKKKIYIGYTDIYPDFNPTDNVIYNILKERYDIEVVDTSIPENNEKIQYLFYSACGNRYLDFNCIRIFVTGENLVPNFNLCDYALGFEHMEFGDRFFRLPIYFWKQYKDDYDLLLSDRIKLAGDEPEKRDFCGIVATNNTFADPTRENFFYALSRYKHVASGGRAYNNIGMPEGVEDKRDFLKNYKFSIAFENSSYPGYCTEKLMQAFAAGNVPIYWGDPTAVDQFNEKAYINCCGMTIEEAVEKVKKVDLNDNLYMEMLREKPLLDDNLREKTEKKLAEWLYGIIDKDMEKARRRPVHGKMAAYEENYSLIMHRYEKLKSSKILMFGSKCYKWLMKR